tara:strand:- start:5750 stop:8137 length:2388 start_codon:yes stop_codon:yes gene_type:complete
MKSKYFLLIPIICLFFCNASLAEQFNFKTSEMKLINEGKLLIANEGTAISKNNDYVIQAKKFEYSKVSSFLKAFNGNLLIKSEKIKIEFDKIKLDKKNQTILAEGNVIIYDLENEVQINTEYILYNEKLKVLESESKSLMVDKFNNRFETNFFEYDLNKNIIKIKEAKLKDFNQNFFEIDLAFINTVTNKLFGKDISVNLNNKFFDKNNEPRLKGNSVIFNNGVTEITKGVFTTCKRRNEKCPPWQLSAEKINHNKDKQVINYKNAWLKIYDVPIVYFPKFFHPDPTVERRSGFLIPTIKNSPNSDSFLSLPYFKVISSNKDLTFKPRIYTEDKILIQTEFRQKNRDSTHISDFSVFKAKNKSSKNHFFYNYDKNLNYLNFEESNLKIKIEKSSNDTYLKGNKIDSTIVKSFDVLENSLNLQLYNSDLTVDAEFKLYEDLSKKKSDRYEYILPKIDITKKIFDQTNLDGDFLFQSNNYIKNYDTNKTEKININNLTFNSNPKITNLGFYNTHEFILKNVNSDAQGSDNYKKNDNYYVSGLFQINSSLPLIKENDYHQKIFKPKVSLKISPDFTKDIRSKSTRYDVNNIFNMSRIASSDTIEGGIALAYGNDFSILSKKDSREIFGLKMANNLRLKENNDLQKNNQIGEKTSNFFGEVYFNPNDILEAKYSNSIKNNLKDNTYENFNMKVSLNNLVTSFNYLNENDTVEKNSYLENTTTYNLSGGNNISFSTRRNKKTDLTEYYNLMYQYKNDCLAASIEYNKDYYTDVDIKPEESIYFKLTIIPLGGSNSPNILK